MGTMTPEVVSILRRADHDAIVHPPHYKPSRFSYSSFTMRTAAGGKNLRSRSRNSVPALCSFCEGRPAAVVVRIPSLRNKKALEQPFCLLHYYTTSAVRVDEADTVVSNQSEFDNQLPAMQELFADVFVELQQELAQESARSFAANANDPLAILHDLNKASKKKRKGLRVEQQPKVDKSAGGFLKDVPLPERLLRTQHEQARKQKELTKRMKKSAAQSEDSRKASLSQRRRPSRKSIWNVVMEGDRERKTKDVPSTADAVVDSNPNGIVCSCGSSNVEPLSTNSSRNQDMAKGETWGNKDREDEVVTRYQCLACGKVWNEEL